MVNKKSFLFTFLGYVLLMSLVFLPSESFGKTLKIGHIFVPASFQHQALEKVFKPYVEEKSGGSLKVEVFPNEQLGHAPDQVEAVKLGMQEMFLGSFAWWGAHVEETEIPNIPFMFDDRDHYHKWIDQILVPKLMPVLIKNANQRFINLDYKWHRGPFRVLCSKRAIFAPEDLKGLRLRLWPARAVQRTWQGFGANTVTIDWSEAYLALKQGVVEAITAPLDVVWPQKFTEITKYITELKQFPQLEIISINENVWQALDKSEQKILLAAVEKAGRWYNDKTESSVQSTIDNNLIKEHNAFYIKLNRQPFVDLFRNKILPKLIEDGTVKEKHMEGVIATR